MFLPAYSQLNKINQSINPCNLKGGISGSPLRPEKKRCLVPITQPYLVFVPYPKIASPSFINSPTIKLSISG